MLPWGGPLATCMNEHLFKCGEYKTRHKKQQTIFQYLFKTIKNKIPNEPINFETIIGLLENFYNYSLEKQNSLFYKKGHFIPILFSKKKWLNLVKDYEILYEFIDDQGELFVIYKKHRNSLNSEYQLKKGVEETLYFRDLLSYSLDRIADKITEYDNEFNLSEKEELNETFVDFLNLHNECNTSRIYSLNYDRVVPKILRKKKIPIFDGFSDSTDWEYTARYYPDEKRILSDFNSLCYYNLHGSIHWKYEQEVSELNLEFIQHPNSEQINYDNFRHGVTNTGEPFFASNIVTGNNKLQRTNLPPLNAFNYAFQKDCIEADEIFIIGYSFDDKHINRVIRNAVIARDKSQKTTIITKYENPDIEAFFKNPRETGFKTAKEIFDHNGLNKDQWRKEDHFLSLKELNCQLFIEGFENYLTNQFV